MEKDNDKERPQAPPESARKQLKYSVMGEATGFALALGAVYVTEYACPAQTKAFIRRLAKKLGEWRGTNAEVEHELARKITDVGLLNLGGAANVALQYGLRRHDIKPEDRQPLLYEAGRLVFGRGVGTATAIGTLALAENFAPRGMRSTELRGAKFLGGSPASKRFSELVLSNTIQSVGAVAGNVPAQLLYDQVLGGPKKDR